METLVKGEKLEKLIIQKPKDLQKIQDPKRSVSFVINSTEPQISERNQSAFSTPQTPISPLPSPGVRLNFTSRMINSHGSQRGSWDLTELQAAREQQLAWQQAHSANTSRSHSPSQDSTGPEVMIKPFNQQNGMVSKPEVNGQKAETPLKTALRSKVKIADGVPQGIQILGENRVLSPQNQKELTSKSSVSDQGVESAGSDRARSKSRTSKLARRASVSMAHYEHTVFEILSGGLPTIPLEKFLTALESSGLKITDPRLKECMHNLSMLQKHWDYTTSPGGPTLNKDAFTRCTAQNAILIQRALKNDFLVSDFREFTDDLTKIYEECKENTKGKVASYIPQLMRYSVNDFGFSLCTVDGQRFSLGDFNTSFTIQSASKPLNYAIAHNDYGGDYVHKFVGQEPSGNAFNKLMLNPQRKPHNPLINSGAITVCSLVKKELKMADRFDYIITKYKAMAGGEYVGFNNAVFLSERETADRNFAIGYLLKENKCFPDHSNLQRTMELYFQLCSVEINCETGSIIAATLANSGICPITGEKILSTEAVRDTLSLMHSCGMYDYSGQFAFKVGLPAKSGVSGVVLLVVPGLLGIAIWSPALDEHGNSLRGIQFCESLVSHFAFHNFDSMSSTRSQSIGSSGPASGGKKDPRTKVVVSKEQALNAALFATARGDLRSLRCAYLRNVNLSGPDYDGRTPLHVAAAGGYLDVCRFLLERCGVSSIPKDRWGFVPLDEAIRFGHKEVVDYLQAWQQGHTLSQLPVSEVHTSRPRPENEVGSDPGIGQQKKSTQEKQRKNTENELAEELDFGTCKRDENVKRELDIGTASIPRNESPLALELDFGVAKHENSVEKFVHIQSEFAPPKKEPESKEPLVENGTKRDYVLNDLELELDFGLGNHSPDPKPFEVEESPKTADFCNQIELDKIAKELELKLSLPDKFENEAFPVSLEKRVASGLVIILENGEDEAHRGDNGSGQNHALLGNGTLEHDPEFHNVFNGIAEKQACQVGNGETHLQNGLKM